MGSNARDYHVKRKYSNKYDLLIAKKKKINNNNILYEFTIYMSSKLLYCEMFMTIEY